MPVDRLKNMPGFSIDRVAAAAGDDPEVLRLENLDTDIRPPQAALDATRAAIDDDDTNSYLPFTGQNTLREAATQHVSQLSGVDYDPYRQSAITAGGTEGMLNVLLATLNVGDEVMLTDPTYAGMINRVRLAGGIPRLAPFVHRNGQWRLDLNKLVDAINNSTRVLFIMNPSMPSGAVLSRPEWEFIAKLCISHDCWLLYNAAMERILYDDRPYLHPASLPGMAERTITVGSVSKEYRMIGWRVGWIVGPEAIMDDINLVGIYNVVTPVGIAQAAATAALQTEDDGVVESIAEWQRRRDVIVEELAGLPLIPAVGGWSMLIDVGAMGHGSFTASDLLLERGKIAATPMMGWGGMDSDQLVRFVFSNEPVERLRGIGERVRRALGVR
ncbi:MAG: pyridoxal phosphate-dependent aminotransferase [Gemmatimonadota bacterium]|nr:pyridoxal phosphate-dependent aminotransferase [Gemmatimonadota bacterium]